MSFNKKIVCTYLHSITKYGYPPPGKDTLKYIDEMTSLGFQSIELEGIHEKHLNEVYNQKEEILSKLEKEKINLPFFCVVLPELTSINPKTQEKQLDLLEKGCELAKAFGCIGILDNAPLPPYQFPDDIPVTRHYDEDLLANATLTKGLSWNFMWDHIVETIAKVCDIAAKYNLTYNLHPAVGVLASSSDGFINIFNAVGRYNLRFNFDTANQFVMKENINLAIARLIDFVDYIHLSDNRGNKVEHLAIGKGKINWQKFFTTLKELRYKGYLGLDIGGSESDVKDLDAAYIESAKYLEEKLVGPDE